MIRRIALIARQEFLKYVSRRGFIISVLMVPLVIAFAALVPMFVMSQTETRVIAVIDRAGGYEEAVAVAVARNDAQSALAALADYAGKYADVARLVRSDPALADILTAPDRVAEIKTFQARGGWHAAYADALPDLSAGAPAFVPPRAHFALASTPRDLATANGGNIRTLARAYLAGERKVLVAGQPVKLAAIVVEYPERFCAGHRERRRVFGTTETTNTETFNFIHWTLTDAFRVRAMQQFVEPSRRSEVNLDVDANIQTFDPTKLAGPPVSLADRLARWCRRRRLHALHPGLLQRRAAVAKRHRGKSTRMIEVLLCCASPQEIMTGKLLGVIAVAS